MPPREFRFVLYVLGWLLLMLAGVMLLPMVADLISANEDWAAFVVSAGATSFIGGLLVLAYRGSAPRFSLRAGYLLTVTAWLGIGFFGSLPLVMSAVPNSFTDAVFETMSGLTTTGSTVLVGLDHMPPGILLWRSLLQWLGGIGIIVTAIVLLPMLRVGGMQLFRSESSDVSDKIAGRTVHVVTLTISAYVVLTGVCALAYDLAGMSSFDAVNHAMTTLATGGFSTRDASLGYFDSVTIEMVAMVFMVAGALPLVLYPRFVKQGLRALRHEQQVLLFLAVLFCSIALLTAWNVSANNMEVLDATRVTAVNVVSVLTDTGYATADFAAWGSFSLGLLFVLMLVGGCAGSTAGAVKIFRWHILFEGAMRHLQLMRSPHRIVNAKYAGRSLSPEMVQSVRNFFFMYLITLLVLSLAVMATGVDFLSSITGVAQAMANAGPSLGPIGGPASNFLAMPDTAKWLLMAAMLLGRLELSTVYVLMLWGFWRD